MIGQKQIPVRDIAGHYWSEIDVLQDYENILTMCAAIHNIGNAFANAKIGTYNRHIKIK